MVEGRWDKLKSKMTDNISISFNKVFSRIVYTDSFRQAPPLLLFINVLLFMKFVIRIENKENRILEVEYVVNSV